MQISELLKAKGSTVFTVKPNATVSEVLGELSRHNVGAVVVSKDGRTIAGIASERDIVRALAREGAAVLTGPIAAIMSVEVQTASPDSELESLMATMTNGRFRHIPVVEDASIVGIVSIGDVVKSRTDELEHDRDLLVDYIGGR
jgi:CBS domain-containing protein